ncbi:MAG: pilin, partial [Pseudomonadota bacterium]
VPRNAYNNYLSMLLLMTDIADIDVGVWALPTADQLALPERGTLGFSVIADEQLLGMEMVSEHSLFDVVGGNAYGGVAVFGVLAAIAIPAYQDYTIRSQVSEGLSLSSFQKVAVAERYLESGRWPNATEAGEMASFDRGKYVSEITVEPGSGAIEITYGLGANIGIVGGTLTMTPFVDERGDITWRCTSTIDNKWLPAVCRASFSQDVPVLALPETG